MYAEGYESFGGAGTSCRTLGCHSPDFSLGLMNRNIGDRQNQTIQIKL